MFFRPIALNVDYFALFWLETRIIWDAWNARCPKCGILRDRMILRDDQAEDKIGDMEDFGKRGGGPLALVTCFECSQYIVIKLQ